MNETTDSEDETEEVSTDTELRMRVRSIDVQLLRILEEMSLGRTETTDAIRDDLSKIRKTLQISNGSISAFNGVLLIIGVLIGFILAKF